jgi:flagellar biosynthesis protein
MNDTGPAPTVAVALHYDFQGAPRVTAKGRGAVAEAIVRAAREHDVAVERNPALAAALQSVELDQDIPEDLYRAVAAILGFLLATGRLDRPGGG